MNIYNYVFYKIYKSTSQVNELYPEIATIIFISVMLFLNIFSGLLVFDIAIEKIGLNRIYLLLTIVLGFNFYYFLKNDKYKMIVDEYDKKSTNNFLDIIIFLYPFISFYTSFRLLKMSDNNIYFTLIGLLLVEIYAYYNKKGNG